jgi:hypothetical protein
VFFFFVLVLWVLGKMCLNIEEKRSDFLNPWGQVAFLRTQTVVSLDSSRLSHPPWNRRAGCKAAVVE